MLDRPTDESRPDLAPAPIRTARPIRGQRRSPLPLARQSLTVVSPSDTAFGDPQPATIDIIILAEKSRDDDVTAEADDMPELDQAGWHRFMTGILEIHIRVVS